MRSRGNDNKDIGLGNIGEEDSITQEIARNTTNALPITGNTERNISRNRSDSYITPGLIKNLKKNKKRIIAKGWLP